MEPTHDLTTRAAAPAERLEQLGADALETGELFGLVLGPGEAAARARTLLDRGELAELARHSAASLECAAALPRSAAVRLAAAFALGRRVEAAVRTPRQPLRSAAAVHRLMAGDLRGLDRETFHVLLLDGKHRLRRRQRISEGTLTSSLVHPREVFGPALREGAAALIVVHNHPSGDPEPSPEDVAVTRRLIEAGALLGVPLLDHVVVTDERHVSLRERLRFGPDLP